MLFEKIRLFFVHLLQRGQAMPIGKKEDVGGGLGGDLRSELAGAEFHLDGEDCRLNILLSNPFPCLICEDIIHAKISTRSLSSYLSAA